MEKSMEVYGCNLFDQQGTRPNQVLVGIGG